MITGVRRSLLYVPGDSEAMLHKAAAFPADILLLNLEDGVATVFKETARENVCRALCSRCYEGHETVVRVNPIQGETGRLDLSASVSCVPDGICLPKVESAAQIRSADETIQDLERTHGIPEGSIRLHAMIESPAGVLRSGEIAAASPRMATLIFGSADYATEMRCRPGEERLEILLALQMIVVSARSAGIDAVDAPCFDLKNTELLRREAEQARRMGFDGKSCLHPGQLETINAVFDVTPAEIAWAERVLAELDAAERRGRALSTLGGQLIDNPHRKTAQRILQRRDRAT